MQMNDIQGLYNSHTSTQVRNKPFSLQNGRVLHVTVHKLVGEGMAEVSASGQKFIAKLDIPLKAGNRYWVRVNQSESGISLSVIQQGSGEKNDKTIAQALIQQLHNKPVNKELINSVIQFINNKVPVTKELLQFASEHINAGNIKSRLPLLIELLKNQLPLSEKVLLSLEAGKGTETFSLLLSRLKGYLSESGSNQETLEIIKKIQDPLQFLHSKQIAVKAIENALNPSESFSTRLGNFELLKSLGIVSRDSTFYGMEKGLRNTFTNAILEGGPTVNQLKDILGNLLHSDGQQEKAGHSYIKEINNILSSTGNEFSKDGAANKSSIEQAVKLIFELSSINAKDGTFSKAGEGLIDLMSEHRKQNLEKNYSILLSKWDGNLPDSNESKIFRKLGANIDMESMYLLRGEDIGQAVKKIIRTLGFNLEFQLHSQPEIAAASTTLKDRLTQLSLHHHNQDIRDLAEKIVLKMNHTSLISWEQSSFMNIIQQFPLYLFGRQTDITVQWMGKEKEKGKIDSDHCRILFYLHLDNLKETLVDMQVQSRVISLSIWNELQAANELSQSFIPGLKEALQKIDYQLTSVKIKKPVHRDSISQEQMLDMHSIPHTGVDLKI
jgi:hypothetical protein